MPVESYKKLICIIVPAKCQLPSTCLIMSKCKQ